MEDRIFLPGPDPRTVRTMDGAVVAVPEGWNLLPPGDAGLTRRVKAGGDFWVVQEKVGRRTFSRGVWAAAETIDRIRAELEAERSTEGYARKQQAASRRREQIQAEYVEDFHGAVVAFIRFHADHAGLADRLARAVTEHATLGWVENCYRTGGETVHVCARHPNGVAEREYRRILAGRPRAKGWGWQTMRRNPGVYVRGSVRQADHRTIALHGWHRMLTITENESKAMRNVAFLD